MLPPPSSPRPGMQPSPSSPSNPAPPRPRAPRSRAYLGLLLALLAAASTGVGGFYLGALHEDWALDEAAKHVPALETFLRAPSFSESANAQDTLQASAAHLIVRLQLPRAFFAARGALANPGTRAPDEHPLTPAVARLRAGIDEFRGTEQELFLIQHLLWTLREKDDLDAWLDLYLDTLYRHPTHPTVARGISEAWHVAQTLGRVEAITAAFRHLHSIPLDLPVKAVIDYLAPETAPNPEESTLP